MRSLILCEGIDDVLILGYFLHKTSGWRFEPKARFAEKFDLPKEQHIELYLRDNDVVAIWAVGGKDSFNSAFEFVSRINRSHPEEGVKKIFILKDRDTEDIDKCLMDLKDKLSEYDIEISELCNGQENKYLYEVEDEQYSLDIIPIIIPFERAGALETVLMQGIEESGVEESYIVKCADEYIDEILASGRLHNYLKHEREQLKARFSAVIAITNPDRSTAEFDKVLMSWEWENVPSVKRHFETITRYL